MGLFDLKSILIGKDDHKWFSHTLLPMIEEKNGKKCTQADGFNFMRIKIEERVKNGT